MVEFEFSLSDLRWKCPKALPMNKSSSLRVENADCIIGNGGRFELGGELRDFRGDILGYHGEYLEIDRVERT